MDVESAEALLVRARHRRGQRDVEGAREDLDRALELEPGHAWLRLVRALVLIDQQEYAAAKADVDRILGAGGGTGAGAGGEVGAAALAVRGWLALHRDGDPRAAERDLSTAIDAGDRQPSTYLTRGWARDALDDHAGALADARCASELSPLNADARFLSGVSRIHLGDPGGSDDLDRAEVLYTASGDQSGRRDVWDMRATIRRTAAWSPGGAAPWLWFGPPPAPDGSPPADGSPPPDESRVPGDGLAGGRAPGRIVIRGGRLSLVTAVLVIRYLVTAVAVTALTALLPGLETGSPVVITVAVVTLLYRMLRAGSRALLTSLVFTVPATVLGRLQVGPLPAVAVLRWLGAGALAAAMLVVAAWVTAWFGLHYRVSGVWSVVGAGAVLGLGTVVSFPVLRRASE